MVNSCKMHQKRVEYNRKAKELNRSVNKYVIFSTYKEMLRRDCVMYLHKGVVIYDVT